MGYDLSLDHQSMTAIASNLVLFPTAKLTDFFTFGHVALPYDAEISLLNLFGIMRNRIEVLVTHAKRFSGFYIQTAL